MNKITFYLSVNRFKRGKKSVVDYGRTFELAKKEKDIPINTALLGKIKGEEVGLPAVVRWDSRNDHIFCVCFYSKNNRKSARFVLATKLPTGEPIYSFKVTGQDVKTGKYISWSAYIKIIKRE